MKIKKAIIPVAGKGTRFLPVTKSIPKEMVPIINVPMINYVIDEAFESGIEEVILVISKGKESILDFFKENKDLEKFLSEKNKKEQLDLIKKFNRFENIKICYQEEQLGLGHALLQAKSFIKENESFAVLLGDDLVFNEIPCTRQLINISAENNNASVIGVMEVNKSETNLYGIVDGEYLDKNTLKMSSMIEKPSPENAPTNLATPGRYILNYKIFEVLEEIPKGAGGEYQLTDAINEQAKRENFLAHIFTGERFDTGQVNGYLDATIEMALKNSELREEFLKSLKKRLDKHNIQL